MSESDTESESRPIIARRVKRVIKDEDEDVQTSKVEESVVRERVIEPVRRPHKPIQRSRDEDDEEEPLPEKHLTTKKVVKAPREEEDEEDLIKPKPKSSRDVSKKISRVVEEDEEINLGPGSSRNTSRTTSSRSSNVDEYRQTSRPNAKSYTVSVDDLWRMCGRYVIVEQIDRILRDASSHGDIPSEYSKIKSDTSKVRKAGTLARALFFMPTRKMLLRELIEYSNNPKREKDMKPLSSKTKLKDFFIQFKDDGPKFPGDQIEDQEFLKASGIPIYDSIETYLENVQEKKDIEETENEEIDMELPSALSETVLEAILTEDQSEISNDREESMMILMEALKQMDDDSLHKFAQKAKRQVQD